MFRIASSTTSSGTITFDNLPQNYKNLHIRIFTIATSNPGYKFNGDATAANYHYNNQEGTGSTVAYGGGSDNTLFYSNAGGGSALGIVEIPSYSSSTNRKILRTFFAGRTATSGTLDLYRNEWKNTQAITKIELTFNNYTRVDVYGMGAA